MLDLSEWGGYEYFLGLSLFLVFTFLAYLNVCYFCRTKVHILKRWQQCCRFCKARYINRTLEELEFYSTSNNPTYTHSSLSKEEILKNHRSVLNIFNILTTKIYLNYLTYIRYLNFIKSLQTKIYSKFLP